MRFPILAILALCLLANLAGASVVNTDVDARQGGDPAWNVVTGATINSTENTVTVKISPGAPRTVQFTSTDTDWYYRSSSGGTNLAVAKGQPLKLRFNQTTVVYFTRQAADGNLTAVPLAETTDK